MYTAPTASLRYPYVVLHRRNISQAPGIKRTVPKKNPPPLRSSSEIMSLASPTFWRTAVRALRATHHRTLTTKPPIPPLSASDRPSPSDEGKDAQTSPEPSETQPDVPLTRVSQKPPLHMRPRRPRHPNTVITGLDSQRAVNLMIDPDGGAAATRTGRSWSASELRLKSFSDLHKLWFILARERDRLIMEKAWCKTNARYWTNGPSNYAKICISMARLKAVVGERVRALDLKRRTMAVEELVRDGKDVPPRLRIATRVDPNKAEVSASGTPPYVE